MGSALSTHDNKIVTTDWFESPQSFYMSIIHTHPMALEFMQRLFAFPYPDSGIQFILPHMHSYTDKLSYIVFIFLTYIAYRWSEEPTEQPVYEPISPIRLDIHPIAHIDHLFEQLTTITTEKELVSLLHYFIQHYSIFLFEIEHFTEQRQFIANFTHILFTEIERHFSILRVKNTEQCLPALYLLHREPSLVLLFILTYIGHTVLNNVFLNDYVRIPLLYEHCEQVLVDVLTELGGETGLEYRYDLFMEDILYILSITLHISVSHLNVLRNYIIHSSPKRVKYTFPEKLSEEIETISYHPSRIRGLWGNELTTLSLFAYHETYE